MQIEETYKNYGFNESRNNTRPGLIRRFLARLIDYQMIFIFFLFTDFLTDGLIMENMHWFMKQVTGIPTQPLTVTYLSLLFAGYFILFHSLGGQTPGKFICAVRVIRQ
ncbi:MAG: RDD family protein, partial [SAR324 cluster bacterium]|nr:RDD family protein [SAR324 cluster bacterium]